MEFVGDGDWSSSGIKAVRCNNKGKILYGGRSQNSEIGGIIGYYASEVSNCNNYEEIIIDAGYTARVAGITTDANVVSNCNNYGDIFIDANLSGYSDVGGISVWSSTVTNCNNYGDITYINGYSIYGLGGIADGGTVTNCRNSGNIYVETNCYLNVGGISGEGTVTNCSNTGDVHVKCLKPR